MISALLLVFVAGAFHDIVAEGCLEVEFYPFGTAVGDANETFADDLTIPAALGGQSVPFYGGLYSEFGVNTNGFIRLGNGTCSCCCPPNTPEDFPNIALFWADHDLEVNGALYFRKVNLVEEPDVVSLVHDDAEKINVDLTPTFVFIATWDDVSRYDGDMAEKNSYQLVLATDGNVTVTIFTYGVIDWDDTGASISFNKGDSETWARYPMSHGHSSLLVGYYSNVGERGRIVTRVDQVDLHDHLPVLSSCKVCKLDTGTGVVTTFDGSTALRMNAPDQKFLFSKTLQSGPFGSPNDQCKFMMRIVTNAAGTFEWLGFSVGVHPNNPNKYKRNVLFDASTVLARGHQPLPIGSLTHVEHITDVGQDLVILIEQTPSGTGWIVRSPNCSYVMTFDPKSASNQIQLSLDPPASQLVGMCQFANGDSSDDLLDCSNPPKNVGTTEEVQSSCDCNMLPSRDKVCMKAHVAL